ncbi:MAG TPA: TlpA disulfide reductase family protein, partial [Terrimicrobium sp.]
MITARSLSSFGLAVLFAVALLVLALPAIRPLFRSAADSGRAASSAPVWELKDPEGKLVKSSDFDGKIVILNFWATWCPPCKAEIPGFIELQKEYGAKGLVVVGVSMDEKGPSVVKEFMARFGVNYPVVMGNVKIMQDFGGQGLPTTFIIDRSGSIVARHVGFASKDAFEKELVPLL